LLAALCDKGVPIHEQRIGDFWPAELQNLDKLYLAITTALDKLVETAGPTLSACYAYFSVRLP
jgi:hypothetical protein